ncbi:hypothetical protein A2773_04340 [Candidatus Gottesmanbacteria bacterium RIFCSPHIGHO2_01_FULL_39_10]|uniref:Uncharacterized protein n=1 Tax=Candidatus Gottesmanbacteria bacterium RIFCSPHIGHO2_01_FULL_39_10 TaxID=1798375 RepID=A0A1F5ZSK1_9BACT|nr:MAG: hypothetical protein A2773_04340 [Candidatus Gottesmanbacteria bacterium RIFCSPHIGHO2_01_FULL_39_10]
MATVINNPDTADNAGIGFLVGVILLIFAAFLFLYIGLPLIRGVGAPSQGGGPNISVPEKVDVNINQPK